MPAIASPFLTGAFAVFAIVLAGVVAYGVGRAAARAGHADVRWRWTLVTALVAALWMVLTWQLAASGVLADVDRRPPPLMWLLPIIAGGSVAVATSGVGRQIVGGLSLSALIGFQGFRLPLELLMHRAYTEGVMPVQMSYSGANFDIVSGATAIPVAWLVARGAPRWVAAAWNLLGAALLANILIIAIRSMPVVAAYGPARLNTWVAWPPFVWLPAVMVFAALAGHLLITRALFARR